MVDALRYAHIPAISVSATHCLIDRIKPRRAILTNLHSDLGFGRTAWNFAARATAYDGLTVELAEPAQFEAHTQQTTASH